MKPTNILPLLANNESTMSSTVDLKTSYLYPTSRASTLSGALNVSKLPPPGHAL